MRQVWIPRAGPPEVLELREARDPLPVAGELRIRVDAIGVNFADVMGRLGLYPDLPRMPAVPGYEVAGRVDSVGRDVETDWVGREVLALVRFGGYADTLCVPERQVFVRPEGMSADEGAALPVNYLTAYQLMVVMGGLRRGDHVLVHSAGGGVGIAAIQLARRIGAEVIGTASAAKHDALKSMGVEHLIDYTREDFEQAVRRITAGRGVELALDAVGGDSWRRSFRALAPTGRLGVFGVAAAVRGKTPGRLGALRALLSGPWSGFSPFRLMNENRGVFGVNLGRLWEEVDRLATWMEDLLEGYRAGEVRPVIAARFPLADAAQAHHFLQDRRNVGKVLLHTHDA